MGGCGLGCRIENEDLFLEGSGPVLEQSDGVRRVDALFDDDKFLAVGADVPNDTATGGDAVEEFLDADDVKRGGEFGGHEFASGAEEEEFAAIAPPTRLDATVD